MCGRRRIHMCHARPPPAPYRLKAKDHGGVQGHALTRGGDAAEAHSGIAREGDAVRDAHSDAVARRKEVVDGGEKRTRGPRNVGAKILRACEIKAREVAQTVGCEQFRAQRRISLVQHALKKRRTTALCCSARNATPVCRKPVTRVC